MMATARLAPLSEEPLAAEDEKLSSSSSKRSQSFRGWLRNQLSPLFHRKSHHQLKVLLSVIGCPLSPLPIHHLPNPPPPPPIRTTNVASSADYIIRQFRATTGCAKMEGAAKKSLFASGRVRVVMSDEPDGGASSAGVGGRGAHHRGCFVVWQMVPDMWLIELSVSGNQIVAGSDGRVAWRRTPWLGAHAAKGDVRPLRRALQGLDPVTIAAVFSPAQHVGEKVVDGEECFVLKLDADPSTLSGRSDSTAEIIRHVMMGYFSQRSGLLVHLEDSQLTRIQSPGAEAMYWETTIASRIGDYRPVDGEGVVIAHSGRSTVNLVRFGFGLRVTTRMEEAWTIDDVVFNVPGLSTDCFIPPEEVRRNDQ